jgi:hypothetical protein
LSFPLGESSRDVKLTSHLPLPPRLIIIGAIPPFPIKAFMTCSGTRITPLRLNLLVYFTFLKGNIILDIPKLPVKIRAQLQK